MPLLLSDKWIGRLGLHLTGFVWQLQPVPLTLCDDRAATSQGWSAAGWGMHTKVYEGNSYGRMFCKDGCSNGCADGWSVDEMGEEKSGEVWAPVCLILHHKHRYTTEGHWLKCSTWEDLETDLENLQIQWRKKGGKTIRADVSMENQTEDLHHRHHQNIMSITETATTTFLVAPIM